MAKQSAYSVGDGYTSCALVIAPMRSEKTARRMFGLAKPSAYSSGDSYASCALLAAKSDSLGGVYPMERRNHIAVRAMW
jgi:hypothetical protein